VKDTTVKPHSRVEVLRVGTQVKAKGGAKGAEAVRRLPACVSEN
jgi:hypothetical protein